MCHNADKSWERRRESQADSELTKIKPFYLALLCAKAKKRVELTRKIRPGKPYSMMKKKSQAPLQLQVTKSGRLIKKQTAILRWSELFEFSSSRNVSPAVNGGNTPQLSSNSSFNLETSAIGEKEKHIRKDERRKYLEVIYNSEWKNPGKFYGFPFFRAIHVFVRGHENLKNIWRTQCGKQAKNKLAWAYPVKRVSNRLYRPFDM